MRKMRRAAAICSLPFFMTLSPQTVGLALLSGAALVYAAGAEAQEAMQADVGKPLQEAQKLAKAGKYQAALKEARKAGAVSGKSEYETFVVNDFIGYLSARLGDHASAVMAYETSLSSQYAKKDRAKRLEALAGMSYQASFYDKTVHYAEAHTAEAGQSRGMQVLIMQSHYLAKDYAKAAEAAAALVASAEQAGMAPEESWLQIQMASAGQVKDHAARHAALVKLVKYAPSDVYWRELLAQSSAAVGRSDKMSLEIARLMRAAGLMKEPRLYMEAAQMAIQLGLPGEAQSIMKEGFAKGVLGGQDESRHRRLLNMAGQLAKEDKATLGQDAPQTAKAKAALASAYASYGDYEKAVTLYKAALAEGGLETPGEVKLHLGQALWAAGDKAAAHDVFASIAAPEKYDQLAEVWLLIGK